MDDIAIFTNLWESHLEQLEQALQVLYESNISLSHQKTEVGAQEVEYLGHRIIGDTVCMTEKHIEAIGKIQAPKNVKALQRILQMVNYWRKLIPNFPRTRTICTNCYIKTPHSNGHLSVKLS